ncbi:MAG: GPW/gp25 family protein, partial [Candidatus Promineifilaceae bacterium]
MNSNSDLIGQGLSFPLRLGPQGGWQLTNHYSELNQAIMIILMTPIGQRVMRPTFGCQIHDLMFEPINSQTLTLAKRYTEEALAMWEPRIDVKEVVVNYKIDMPSAISLEVVYRPKNEK